MKECIFIQLEQVLQTNCVDVEKHDDEVSIISYTYEMIFKMSEKDDFDWM